MNCHLYFIWIVIHRSYTEAIMFLTFGRLPLKMEFIYFVYFMCVEIMCTQGNMRKQPVAECFTLSKYIGKKMNKSLLFCFTFKFATSGFRRSSPFENPDLFRLQIQRTDTPVFRLVSMSHFRVWSNLFAESTRTVSSLYWNNTTSTIVTTIRLHHFAYFGWISSHYWCYSGESNTIWETSGRLRMF